ncbi:hypothetical protein NUW58_g185 [Xylaria curta]|uniref:Uncharacterized protein n=1 Tax=Xylaria curta TaxID=42375 RepID=A0ACC1PQA0_9PEZI|nr:hypothetical protein NUW58_g185 [Xylaria curta]
MRYSLAVSALSALCAAQELPWDIIESADPPPAATVPYGVASATTVVYNSETAIAAVVADVVSDPLPQATDLVVPEKRDVVRRVACQAQSLGDGPRPEIDTAAAFLAYPAFSEAAESAVTPDGYASNYRNLNASSNAYGYLGFTTLKTYDTQSCANRCTNINGCRSFNIFFERNPAFEPATSCPDSQSTTFIKCVFWGGPASVYNAKNTGFRYYDFEFVIAGSNAYDSTVAPLEDGYATPTSLGFGQLNAPVDCAGFDTYLGSKMFTDGPFDPSLCAAACSAQSEYNLAHPPARGPVQTCQFFNTYLLLKNGLPEGQICTMYSKSWDATYSSTSSQERNGDRYSVAYSFTYANSTDPGSPRIPCPVASASSLIAASTLQPYCSSLLGYTTPVVTSTEVVPVTVPSTTIRSTFTRVATITSTVTSTLRITTGGSPVRTMVPVRRDVVPGDVPEDVPAALQTFATDVVSSACSLQATPVTVTSTAHATSTSTVIDGRTTVVTTGNYVSTTRTTVTTTTTTYVAPDPTNTMWVSPSITDAGKYIKSCWAGTGGGGMCQSNYAPDGREGFRVTSDHYLYSTTYGTYFSATISSLYNPRTLLSFSSTTDKSKAAAVFYKTSNGDGTSKIRLVDPATNTEFSFCFINSGSGTALPGDYKTGLFILGYGPNSSRPGWCVPTTLTIKE